MTSTDPSPASSDRLSLLYHLSQTFNSSLDLDEVLNSVMDEVISVTGAERGFVALLEADGGSISSPWREGWTRRPSMIPSFRFLAVWWSA